MSFWLVLYNVDMLSTCHIVGCVFIVDRSIVGVSDFL